MRAMWISGRGRLWILAVLLPVMVAGGWFGLGWYREHKACQQRGAALSARFKKLDEAAHRRIRIGIKSEEVFRFLKENGLSSLLDASQNPRRIIGTASDVGCPQIFGCGEDVMIRVEVQVDDMGEVISPAAVDGMYTNCL